jgi:hypothetical protein
VTFAVDWVAHRLADKLRNLGRVAVVTVASDNLDPFPDRIAFPSESEAVDWVAGEVQRRLDHRVSHSPYPVSDEDLQHWEAEEMTLIQIDVERL